MEPKSAPWVVQSGCWVPSQVRSQVRASFPSPAKWVCGIAEGLIVRTEMRLFAACLPTGQLCVRVPPNEIATDIS